MEDLFKQFRENLEGRPEPPYEKGDWEPLAARLDSHKEGKKRFVSFAWWWLALPMLLLLLGSNMLIFKELHIAEQKLTALETRHDTVYVERVVYRTDTIYQTRNLRERVVEYLPTSFAINNAATSVGRVQSPDNIERNVDTVSEASDDATIFSLVDLEKIGLLASPPFKLPAADLPLTTVAQVDFEKRKTLRQILYPATPKDFSLAVNGGLVRPVGNGLVNGSGYVLGMEGRVGFSPRLALWLDASYSEATAEVDRMDEALGVPKMQPPADEFSFLSADVQYRTWQYAAGMQYALLDRKGWKGWFGAGYGAVSVLPYYVTYDFVNSANLEWPVKGGPLRPGLLGDYLLLRLGVERKLTRHLYGQLMATGRTRLGGKGLQPADLLGLRAGVMYGF